MPKYFPIHWSDHTVKNKPPVLAAQLKYRVLLIAIIAILSCLSACGQTGPLYLADDPAHQHDRTQFILPQKKTTPSNDSIDSILPTTTP